MIRAVVIDDSAYNRVTLTRILESSGHIQVVATAVNGEDGIKQVLRHGPDLITLDLEMPVMDGFAFLRWLMANRPTPVIAVSSRSSDRSVFKALELGAVDFIAKPGGRVSSRLEEIQRDLIEKALEITKAELNNVTRRIQEATPVGLKPEELGGEAGHVDLVVIGASTGGPPALQTMFNTEAVLPVPFVIAQHMPATFTRLFAERVNRLSRYEVREAEDGQRLRPGWVYVAPGGQQTRVGRDRKGMRLEVADRKVTDLYAPSVNDLFRSASEACEDRLLAVVLTGMGDDGATAMKGVRDAGGRTIAESADTAIIFGMPAEAIRAGGVEFVLPLHEIPGVIQSIFLGKERPN